MPAPLQTVFDFLSVLLFTRDSFVAEQPPQHNVVAECIIVEQLQETISTG